LTQYGILSAFLTAVWKRLAKERCLAILDEMQCAFSSYVKSTCGLNIPDMLSNVSKLYEMPEKQGYLTGGRWSTAERRNV